MPARRCERRGGGDLSTVERRRSRVARSGSNGQRRPRVPLRWRTSKRAAERRLLGWASSTTWRRKGKQPAGSLFHLQKQKRDAGFFWIKYKGKIHTKICKIILV